MTGSRCTGCRRTVYPAVDGCPLCGSRAAVPVELADTGRVETYTTVGGTSIAEVRLDDGTLVVGRLEVSDPAVGLGVRLSGDEGTLVFA